MTHSHSMHLHFLSLVASSHAPVLVEPIDTGSMLVVEEAGVIIGVKDPTSWSSRPIGLRTPSPETLIEDWKQSPFARALVVDGDLRLNGRIERDAVVDPPAIPWRRWLSFAEGAPYLSAGVDIDVLALRRISRIADRIGPRVRIGANPAVVGMMFARFSCPYSFVAFPCPISAALPENVVLAPWRAQA